MFKKKKVSDKAYKNLIESITAIQEEFLVDEHKFLYVQLENKSGKELCAECGYKELCAEGVFPECLDR